MAGLKYVAINFCATDYFVRPEHLGRGEIIQKKKVSDYIYKDSRIETTVTCPPFCPLSGHEKNPATGVTPSATHLGNPPALWSHHDLRSIVVFVKTHPIFYAIDGVPAGFVAKWDRPYQLTKQLGGESYLINRKTCPSWCTEAQIELAPLLAQKQTC